MGSLGGGSVRAVDLVFRILGGATYSMSRNSASGLIKILPGLIFGPILGSIPWGSGPKMCPKRAGALLGHILGPDRNGMDPKIGPKIGPGRILIKPEALLRDIE